MRGFVSICLGYEFSTCEKVPWSLKSSVYSEIVFGNEGPQSFISLVVCCHCFLEKCLYRGNGNIFYLLFIEWPLWEVSRFCQRITKFLVIPGPGYGIIFMCSIYETQRWRQSLTQQQNEMEAMVLSTTATQTRHLLEPRFRTRSSWLPVSGCSIKKKKSLTQPKRGATPGLMGQPCL